MKSDKYWHFKGMSTFLHPKNTYIYIWPEITVGLKYNRHNIRQHRTAHPA
jgi:hypothetical protein